MIANRKSFFHCARLATVIAAITPLGMPAQADVLVSNIGVPVRDVTKVSEREWASQSFTTDANAYKLLSIDLLLGALTGSPDLFAELHADTAGSPGATLASFSLGGIGTGAPALFTLPGSLLDLNASSAYWIVLGATGNGSFGWAYAQGNSQSGLGALGAYGYSADTGATWGSFGTDDPYNVRVNVAAVPEPQTAALLLLGLVGVFGRRHLQVLRK